MVRQLKRDMRASYHYIGERDSHFVQSGERDIGAGIGQAMNDRSCELGIVRLDLRAPLVFVATGQLLVCCTTRRRSLAELPEETIDCFCSHCPICSELSATHCNPAFSDTLDVMLA